jgi:hypothetical protein
VDYSYNFVAHQPVSAIKGIPGVLARAAQRCLQWYDRAQPTVAQIRAELTEEAMRCALKNLSMSLFHRTSPDFMRLNDQDMDTKAQLIALNEGGTMAIHQQVLYASRALLQDQPY